MCCFSSPTEVHGTSIFARMLRPGTQGLVYQMQYTAKSPTAMILPLPVRLPAKEDAVRFKSLKEYPDFFAALGRAFPAKPPSSHFGSKAMPEAQPAAASALEVHEVGDFVASFVPTVDDFSRLDAQFVLSKDVWQKVPTVKGYGFAVFQLKATAGKPHPIAFEWDTALGDTVFFPTLHIHDGTVHEKDDFDHVLFLQEPVFDAKVSGYEGPDEKDSATGFVRSEKAAKESVEVARTQGLVSPDHLVHRVTMRGSLPNRDTFVDVKKVAMTARGCSRCDAAGADLAGVPLPVGLGMAGFAWVVGRRDRLRRTKR